MPHTSPEIMTHQETFFFFQHLISQIQTRWEIWACGWQLCRCHSGDASPEPEPGVPSGMWTPVVCSTKHHLSKCANWIVFYAHAALQICPTTMCSCWAIFNYTWGVNTLNLAPIANFCCWSASDFLCCFLKPRLTSSTQSLLEYTLIMSHCHVMPISSKSALVL